MQQGRQREEQLVGDRILVGPVLVPTQATAAGVVPASLVAGEDGPGRVEVTAVTGQVISRDPGQRPPPVVVEIAADEVGVPLPARRERRLDVPSVATGPRALP